MTNPQLANGMQAVAKETTEVADKVAEVESDATIAPIITKVIGAIPKKVRAVIHTANGIIGIAGTIAGAVAVHFTGDANIALVSIGGALLAVESAVSLSHLGDS